MFGVVPILFFVIGFIAEGQSNEIKCSTKFEDLSPEPEVFVVCPKDCLKVKGKVCGTSFYSEDSLVCKSALHAGILHDKIGGALGVLMHPPQAQHRASRNRGVKSKSCSSTGSHSYSFQTMSETSAYYKRPDVGPGQTVGCSVDDSITTDATNNCLANHCQNGGTCESGQNQFKCICTPDFTGADCSIGLNYCKSAPCQNNGVCDDVQDDFKCTCTSEYAGRTCSKTIAQCYAGVSNVTKVANDQMTASSIYSPTFKAQFGRLNNPGFKKRNKQQGCWSPKKGVPGQWLQVDFLKKKTIYGVITQGRPINALQYVTEYRVSYSINGKTFKLVKDDASEPVLFQGNNDRATPKVNYFPDPIEARFVRLIIEKWSGYPSCRVEYLLC